MKVTVEVSWLEPKPLPVTVTSVPVGPAPGETPVTLGGVATVNASASGSGVSLPVVTFTDRGPGAADAPTVMFAVTLYMSR